MKDYNRLIQELVQHSAEEEWLEFKENWYEPNGIGEYISALSNAAASCKREFGYLIWGVRDDDHKIVGTNFDYKIKIKNEPFEHHLARKTTPDIAFRFITLNIDGKKLVILEISAANKVPTSFDGIRYIRIGSSKVNVSRYPDREAALFAVLNTQEKTIENTESKYQDLCFNMLFTYYSGKGITLKEETFRQNLGFLTKDGKYNILAQLLSDDSKTPVRVSIFLGETRNSPLYSIKEFGNTCMLFSLDNVLRYADVVNIVQACERDRIMTRKDVPLFDMEAFREAAVNAFLHNKWTDLNAPMISVYSNRIEIISRGARHPKQTKEGFFMGESIPVNQALSDIFLQLHISERSGRGVPIITEKYGRDIFDFRENSIAVSFPFNRIQTYIPETYKPGNLKEEKAPYHADSAPPAASKPNFLSLNPRRKQILRELKKNPYLTQRELKDIIGAGISATENNIRFLRESGFIERIGSKKSGHWELKLHIPN